MNKERPGHRLRPCKTNNFKRLQSKDATISKYSLQAAIKIVHLQINSIQSTLDI